jgi:predicted O-methyltransferase YrrM
MSARTQSAPRDAPSACLESHMNLETWTAVDAYFADALTPPDPVLDAALDAARAAGLPDIQVSCAQGKLLMLLARAIGAGRILEIGTLGGYSTIWLARALPVARNAAATADLQAGAPGGAPDTTGRVVTLEYEPRHAEVARANLTRAGLIDRVDIHLGAALDTLPDLAADIDRPFDFIFIDADKENMPAYFDWSVKLARPGALIIADNVVREGDVINPDSPDPRVQGVRRMIDLMSADPRVTATVIQTVGTKGYDGFALAFVS